MKSYVALFRGINVGGKSVIPMAALRDIFEAQNCLNVRSYIQSGNVVFDTDVDITQDLIDSIRNSIAAQFSFYPPLLILSASDWQNAVDNNPYPHVEGKTLHFFFLASTPSLGYSQTLDDRKIPSESYSLRGLVLYLHTPDGIGNSKLARKIESALGCSTTARNWNTVTALAQILNQ